MLIKDIETIIQDELRFFDSDEQRSAFQSFRVSPESTAQTWQYSDELHNCIVIASNGRDQIVYCATGFGPECAWSIQFPSDTDLGMDGQWYSYLYEAFFCSTMWTQGVPPGFCHMARGER